MVSANHRDGHIDPLQIDMHRGALAAGQTHQSDQQHGPPISYEGFVPYWTAPAK